MYVKWWRYCKGVISPISSKISDRHCDGMCSHNTGIFEYRHDLSARYHIYINVQGHYPKQKRGSKKLFVHLV